MLNLKDDSQTEFKKRALKIILSKKFKDYCDLVKDVWEHLHKQKLISYSLFDSKSIESVFKQIAGIMLYMELQCHNFPLVQRLNSLIFGTKGVGKTYMLKSFYEVTHLISDSIIPIYVDYSRSKETPFELILKRVFQLQILNEEEFNDLDDALIKLSQLNKYIMFFADEIQVLFNSLSDLKYQEIIIQLVQIGKSAGHSGILSGDSYKVQSLAFNPPPGYGRCDLNDTVYLPILLHPIRSFDEIKGLIKSRYPYDITDEFVNETFNITGGIGRNIDDFLRSQTQIKSNSKFASLLLESAHHSNLLRIAAAIFNSNTINQSKFDIWNQGTISKIDFDSSIDLDNYVYLNILWAKDSIGLFTKKYELLFPCDFEIIKSLMQTSNPNYLDVALAICYDQDGTMNLSAHKANIYIEYHVRKRIIGYPNSKFNGFYTNGNTFSENLIRINSSSILGAKNLNKQFCTWSKEWSFDGLGFDIEHKTVKVHYLQVKTRKHQNEIDDKYLEYEVFSKVKKGFSKIKSSMMKYKCKRPKSQKSQQNDQEELIFNGYTIVLSSLTLVTSAAQVIGAPDKISVDGVECEFKVICGKEFYVLIGPNQFYENQLQTSAYYSY